MMVYAVGQWDHRSFREAPAEAASDDGIEAFVKHFLKPVLGLYLRLVTNPWPHIFIFVIPECVKNEIELLEILISKSLYFSL